MSAAGADPAPHSGADPAPPGGDANDPQVVLRRQEQHLRRQMAGERAQMQAEFDQQKQAWQAKLDKFTQLEALLAKRDPLALATAAGWSEADYEPIAHTFYAASPEGKKDPARARAAQATLAERERQTALEKVQKELEDLKSGISKREQEVQQRAQEQAVITNWLDTVGKAIGDDAPLARAASDKELLNQRILAVTGKLWTESGPSDDLREMPTPAAVLKAHEIQRRAELEAFRPEYEAIAKLTASPKPAPAPKPTTDPNPNPANPTSQAPPARRSRAEIIAGIQQQRATNGT